jgi:2-polyprenyl-3-methyl-5-hydroxy-6-metoxy-1,4-benzoquinol methylase
LEPEWEIAELALVMSLTYNPEVFEARDIAEAKRIILTDEGSSTEERWRIETPAVADLIARSVAITPDSTILDYGCGIGRLAKELIARHGCRVIGVDITQSMRNLATGYVASDHFLVCSPLMLADIVARGLRFDAALAIWVFQHCLCPTDDIALIACALKSSGNLFVLNNLSRVVPTKEKSWVDDRVDVRGILFDRFALERDGSLPGHLVAPAMVGRHFWALYRRSE